MLSKSFFAANALLLLSEVQSLAVDQRRTDLIRPPIETDGLAGLPVEQESIYQPQNPYNAFLYDAPEGMSGRSNRFRIVRRRKVPLVKANYSEISNKTCRYRAQAFDKYCAAI